MERRGEDMKGKDRGEGKQRRYEEEERCEEGRAEERGGEERRGRPLSVQHKLIPNTEQV